MKQKALEGSTYLDHTFGYVMEKRDGRWKRQHRLVMEAKLGRKLQRNEYVHHINEDKTDNRPENLTVMSPADHAREHGQGRRMSEITLARMRAGAARRIARPGHREMLSERAKTQHREGRFGKQSIKQDKQ